MHDQVETVFKAIQFIESHLKDDVNISDIADEVGYSLFHFMRIFNRVVHHTPYDYLMRRRLSEAGKCLQTSSRRIIDIAQDFCFANQESFSRSFKRMFHTQPSQWRENQSAITFQMMPPMSLSDLEFINRGDFAYPIVEIKESVIYGGVMTRIDFEPDAFEIERRKAIKNLFELTGSKKLKDLAAITLLSDQKRANGYFFLGNENFVNHPPPFVNMVLPAGRYARITLAGNAVNAAKNYLLHTWFPRNGLCPAGEIEIELLSAIEGKLAAKGYSIPIMEVKNEMR